MIFTASLNVPVKKAFKKNVVPSNVNKICENLILDPDSTRMTCVILGPKDFVGPKAAQLEKALNHKHPNICVIYLYTSNADADLCPNANREQARKITEKVVAAAFEKYVGEHMDETGQRAMSSADFDAPDNIPAAAPIPARQMEPGDDEEEDEWSTRPVGLNRTPTPTPTVSPTPSVRRVTPVSTNPQSEVQSDHLSDEEIRALLTPDNDVEDDVPPAPAPAEHIDIPVAKPDVLPTQPLSTETPVPGIPNPGAVPVRGTVESQLGNVSSYKEWELFKTSMRHDSMVQSLILEHSEYEGLAQMLEVLDTQIQAVWRDSTMTSDQKFTEIKRIGLQKSTLRAGVNAINIEKAISIISTIVLAAQRTVDDKLNSIDASVYKITSDKEMIADTSFIDKAIQNRTKVQFELLEIGRGILDIYKSTQNFISGEISELDKNLPSSNAFINEMIKPIGTQIFTPSNTAELVKRMSQAMQENQLVWSQLEDKVEQCIDTMFQLCNADEKLINYQQQVIAMMKANRVESVVVADTLLKRILRLYVGTDNTGRSATAITWSGILSKRGNTLLIDITGRAKFKDYGITPTYIGDFMNSRIERPMLCVESRGKLNAEEISNLISQVRTRLNYYQYVNVIVAPEDTDIMNQLSEEAYVIHYITNCSTASIDQMRKVVAANTVPNIAKKLIVIDTPISPLTIADNIGVDLTNTKLIPLPALNEIRACALKHDRPYDYPEITRIYEEAFR